jgi:hypothetical protein
MKLAIAVPNKLENYILQEKGAYLSEEMNFSTA